MKGKKISVLMTVFKKATFLQEAIESILSQTYTDFEFLIIIEHEASNRVIEIVRECARQDERIKIVFNKEHLGFANSLNAGIKIASGEYIARMDDDDISMPQRFARQIELLDGRPDVGVCGTLQYLKRPNGDEVLVPYASESGQLKAELLFGCQITHTSVMFRRALFIENKWFYHPESLAEDFDLWLRIIDKTNFYNIPAPLVKHRYGFENISIEKGQRLTEENVEIISNSLKSKLGIDPGQWPKELFYSWRYHYSAPDREMSLIIEGMKLLLELEERNRAVGFADCGMFARTLKKRFLWICNRNGLASFATLVSAVYMDNDIENFNHWCMDIMKSMWDIDSATCADAMGQMLNIPAGSRILLWGKEEAWESFRGRLGDEALRKYHISPFLYSVSSSVLAESNLSPGDFDYILFAGSKYFMRSRKMLMEGWNIPKGRIRLSCCVKGHGPEGGSGIYEDRKDKNFILMNTPGHKNIGDHAIAEAEKDFLADRFPEYGLVEITAYCLRNHRADIRKHISPNDIIIVTGGGFLGTLWFEQGEAFVRNILLDYPENAVIIFPQTMYYENTQEGEIQKNCSRQIYLNHPNVRVILREANSYRRALDMLGAKMCYLIPDIVLSMSHCDDEPQEKPSSIGVCLKSDKESILTGQDKGQIMQVAARYAETVRTASMLADHNLRVSERRNAIHGKIAELKRYKAVVTDALHCMILCAVSGVPCVSFDSITAKNSGVYAWIRQLGYIAFCGSTEMLPGKLEQVCAAPKRKFLFDYGPFAGQLEKIVKESMEWKK